MARCSDVARRLGVSDRTVRRRCDDGSLPAVRNERGDYEIDDAHADALRPADVVRRQTVVSPRAALLAAHDALERAARAYDAGRLDEGRRELERARRDVAYAAGVDGRAPRREGP